MEWLLLLLAVGSFGAPTAGQPSPPPRDPNRPQPRPGTTTRPGAPGARPARPLEARWAEAGRSPFAFLHDVSTRLDCPSAWEVFLGDWGGCHVVTVGNAEQETEIARWPDAPYGNVRIRVECNGAVPPYPPCVKWTWDVPANGSGAYNPNQMLVVSDGQGDCFDIVMRPWRPEWQPQLVVVREGSLVRVALRTFMGKGREQYTVDGDAVLVVREFA